MSEAAHGTISAQRTTRRPGNSRFRNCASASETSSVTATTTATQTTVLATTVGSASCSARRT